MTEPDRLNRILEQHAPAVHRCLSPLGRRVALPLGNLVQSAEASGTRINATIGQITDGRQRPLPLPAMASLLSGLDPAKCFLYSPAAGHADVRAAWGAHQRETSGGSTVATSRPQVTCGLTHGLSLVSDLFADEDTDIIVPIPAWENYEHTFTLWTGARMLYHPFYRDGRYDVESLAERLREVRSKAIVILSFPGNPTGFSPTAADAVAIAEVVTAHRRPLVVVCDDAYQGFAYEPGLAARSIFWEVAERADPERHVVFKVDGATKELLFFPGRVGFLTHTAAGVAEAALESKLLGVARGSVGSPPGPSQAMVLAALRDPGVGDAVASRVAEMKARYRTLKDALSRSPALRPFPFNSGLFALVGLPDHVEADVVRRRLIADHSIGTIAVPEVNALRIAFCSTREEDLPEVVERMAATVAALS